MKSHIGRNGDIYNSPEKEEEQRPRRYSDYTNYFPKNLGYLLVICLVVYGGKSFFATLPGAPIELRPLLNFLKIALVLFVVYRIFTKARRKV